MNKQSIDDDNSPAEVDFSKGVRGLHHIPSDAKVFLPTSIERSVWQISQRKPSKGALICPISSRTF